MKHILHLQLQAQGGMIIRGHIRRWVQLQVDQAQLQRMEQLQVHLLWVQALDLHLWHLLLGVVVDQDCHLHQPQA